MAGRVPAAGHGPAPHGSGVMADRFVALPEQTIGPFFHFSLTTDAGLGCMAGPEAAGERIRIRVRLLDGDGAPVNDGMIELWQADADGRFGRFGRLATDGAGESVFETVCPGRVDDAAAHISVTVFARGLLGRLCTRIYFEGDAALAEDAVLRLIPEERRETLLARRIGEGEWVFEVRLQGEQETVFFDV